MTLALAQYKNLPLKLKPLEKTPEELNEIIAKAQSRRRTSHHWSLDNYAQRALLKYASDLLQLVRKPNAEVYTKSTLSYWTIKDGQAHREKQVTYQAHRHLYSGKVESRAIAKPQYTRSCLAPSALLVKSSNFPLLYPSIHPGTQIVQYFYDTVTTTSPYLPDLTTVEWRFESLHNYDKEAIDFAVGQLTAKGFNVLLHPPYNVLKKDTLCAVQAIGIQIPPNVFISSNAPPALHPSYLDDFSVHNVLVLSMMVPNKFPPFPKSIFSAAQVLDGISQKLSLIGSQDPLVKRCTFPVPLDAGIQYEVLHELELLGYKACLDNLSIRHEFIGGNNVNYPIQYVLIDLP